MKSLIIISVMVLTATLSFSAKALDSVQQAEAAQDIWKVVFFL